MKRRRAAMSEPTKTRADLRFRRRERLRGRGAFDAVFRRGRRLSNGRLTIWAHPNGLAYSRFGVTVGKAHGGAVRRNRFKRLLREGFRLSRARLPAGYDYVARPRVGLELTLAGVLDSLERLCAKLPPARGRSAQTPDHGGQDG
ncbi:MAG: ribonuclease P protein component [Planctomycetota bacterium]|nr:MAG: ribonuclease P protein component [Planctomycetota bacterium]